MIESQTKAIENTAANAGRQAAEAEAAAAATGGAGPVPAAAGGGGGGGAADPNAAPIAADAAMSV